MSGPAGRSLEVDFLRGAVLIVIAIDHISGGVLQHAMLHSYAYCDAAEVFVFLGGYASAAAYARLAAQRGETAARRRFAKRAWEIYCAYLLAAALMLACGALLTRAPAAPPVIDDTAWPVFANHPVRTALDIALLRRQPFLSAVLPMYVLFALVVPLAVPLARRAPALAVSASLVVWLVAPWLGAALPDVDGGGWPFNPFAWQLMFVFGVVCRLHPVPVTLFGSAAGRRLTRAAFVVALTFAFVKLCLETHPTPGYMKQNLASVRIVSFLSLAWLCALAIRLGWLRTIAQRLPGVVTVGKQGLVCFVCGTVVSVAIDSALALAHVHADDWFSDLPIRLLGDFSAVAALLLIGQAASRIKARSRPATVPAAMACVSSRAREYERE
ncbi:OpgC domain-containing protein [Trinickia caryophylli]|uniref:OpgC protein n=1 Tax=Trinickia caryophylli TaxID=28094 RepID=A0A1X7CLM4_TRICW|nr:OpgC domain-containing protein [Trinickia caryophylli]PMS09052.1 OpgC domain-containing protein [Trinickia caryophylli]TRX20003.1 OpgC domain-containing protein [Trinickia caryophylli]WQE12653.1 OpgC domain-containing protein [Trinickia caryophylli]SME98385.1 hypothetical protein SAMN06295900_101532 [Trinickia caryophylli]GLU30355.1 hypothetical protein Busp01_01970 [Trinickia caryophylli]